RACLQHADDEDHKVKQALSAGPRIFRKVYLHENVNGGEEECVADPMQYLNEYDEFLILREESVHSETCRVTQDSEDHRRTPAEPLERRGENSHREDLGDLADTHDRHDPVTRTDHD